jgi:Lipocalin-like domain
MIQNHPLIGTWKLISATAIHSDGTVNSEVYGVSPTGYITYTAEGHMMVMFSRSDRALLSQEVRSPLSKEMSTIPIEELAQAFITFNAYAGTYTVDGDIVYHHLAIASIPNRVGTTLVRTFILSDNRLILKTPETISDGISQVFELVWERLKFESFE